MNLPTQFISCDWGTTNFRLRLVATADLQVLAEEKTDRGIKSLRDTYRQGGTATYQDYGLNYLSAQVARLGVSNPTTPVVVSGMASANIGLQELPYAHLPIEVSGRTLIWSTLQLPGGRPVILISGVRDTADVMRGEETQALGLLHELPTQQKGVLILPGTHSKHLCLEAGRFVSFTTYLTGELFALLTRHSLLRHSLEAVPPDTVDEENFLTGVRRAIRSGLSTNLFSVRARQLLDGASTTNSYFYLSGLVIGDELKRLQQEKGTIFLAATQPFATLYRLALQAIVPEERFVVLDDQTLSRALLAGQKKILALYAAN
ncbi:MAG: 2-dehydro-3-deoxygalactonokinase [Bacteroidota bacterium]